MRASTRISAALAKPAEYDTGKIETFFALGAELGSGGCATVYAAVRLQDASKWAVKRLDRSGFELALLERELAIMRELRHESLVHLEAAYSCPKFIDLVLELVGGGELFDAIVEQGTLAESDARSVMKQLVHGMAYVHAQGVAHRDLKAENVLLLEKGNLDKIKIADFGLANVLGTGAALNTSCGTPDYVAPEVLLGEEYEFAVDQWSLGILAYILLCGYPPFWADTQSELFRKIVRCKYTFNRTDWADVSDTGINFVAKLLVKSPSERMTARESLHHPWILAETAPLAPPLRAKNSARNLADYNAARKSGSTNYVPLPLRSALGSPLKGSAPGTPSTPMARLVQDAAAFSTPQTPPPLPTETPSPTPPRARIMHDEDPVDDDDDDSSSSTSSLPPEDDAAVDEAAARAPEMVEVSRQASSGKALTCSDDELSSPEVSQRRQWVPKFASGAFADEYTLGPVIGRGGCATVFEAHRKSDNELVAVKRLSKASFEIQLLERELAIMRRLRHENILRLYEAFESSEYVDLVMEHVDGGELFDAIVSNGGLDECDCARIVRQILHALCYMHSLGVAHRDLKAENVLVSKDLSKIKIADFGLSNVLESAQRLLTSCGTPDYVAPEVLKGQGYGVPVDVWSCGILTYIMLCGYPPFWSDTQNGLFKRIIKGEFKFPSREWAHTTKLSRRFIRSMLITDPNDRPTARECLDLPWVAQEHDNEPNAKQARRGNSVANLRVYQAARAREEPPIPSQVAHSGVGEHEKKLKAMVKQGAAVTDDFVVVREIGRGGTAVVFEAKERRTGERWAIKRIERSLIDPDVLQRELAILAGVKHANILHLHAVYEAPGHIDVVMEHAAGGELFDMIVARQRFTEDDARMVMRQVFDAIVYLHDSGIAHRDIKAENVLVCEPPSDANGHKIHVKIIDFGLSNVLTSAAQLRTSCGTPDYVAPEVLKGQGYGVPVDVWSCGVLTYIILCGYPPFHDDRGEVYLFRKIMGGEFAFDPRDWDAVSDTAKDFIRHLLVVEPAQRYTARQAVEHPWLSATSAAPASPASAKKKARSPKDGDATDALTKNLSSYRRRRRKERDANVAATAKAAAQESASRKERRRRKAARHAARKAEKQDKHQ